MILRELRHLGTLPSHATSKVEVFSGDDCLDDFTRVELRVGRIVSAEVFAEARKPAYVLQVDFGPDIGMKKSSAQITRLYSTGELVGKLVVGVVNFPPKQIGPLMSECLVTGFHDERGDVALCVPDKPVPLGAKLL